MTFSLKRVAAAIAGASMIVTPVAASAAPANPAAKLSIAGTRAGTPTSANSRLGGGISTTTLINVGILAALVVIVLVATNGGNDDNSNGSAPTSP